MKTQLLADTCCFRLQHIYFKFKVISHEKQLISGHQAALYVIHM